MTEIHKSEGHPVGRWMSGSMNEGVRTMKWNESHVQRDASICSLRSVLVIETPQRHLRRFQWHLNSLRALQSTTVVSTIAPSIAMKPAHLEKTFKDSEIPTCLPIVYAASLVAIRRTRLFRCIRTPSRSSHFTDQSSSVGVHTNSEYVLRSGFSLSPPLVRAQLHFQIMSMIMLLTDVRRAPEDAVSHCKSDM